MRTVAEVIRLLARPNVAELPAPPYHGAEIDLRARVGCAVESMKNHMTDEGYQLFKGLEYAGYTLCGHDIKTKLTVSQAGNPYRVGVTLPDLTDVPEVLRVLNPCTVVVQDKREWEGRTADRSRDPRMAFKRVQVLKESHDIFKATVLKDAQHNPLYHRQAAGEMGAHAWVVYYHPRIIKHLAPYVRERHLIRTYHTLDSTLVPPFKHDRPDCALLSGAVSDAYPLRKRLLEGMRFLPGVVHLKHPGYHRSGCVTPDYLRHLNGFKVSIATSSRYGYALRKVIEGVACGCRVITDLPSDDVLPLIDDNLVRVDSHITLPALAAVLRDCYATYDPVVQNHYSTVAKSYYDYRATGHRLASQIEELRRAYNS